MESKSKRVLLALAAVGAIGIGSTAAILGASDQDDAVRRGCPGGSAVQADGTETCVTKFSYHGKSISRADWEAAYQAAKTGAATTAGDTAYLFDSVAELDAFQSQRKSLGSN